MRKKEKKDNSERWLLTYSDLITLLMIFFVIMYAMSNVDTEKYKEVATSLSGALGGSTSVIGSEQNSSVIDTEVDTTNTGDEVSGNTEELKLENLKNQVEKYLSDNNIKSGVDVSLVSRGLVVSMKEGAFFESGSDEILPKNKNKIIGIGRILDKLGKDIRVEGHTDNVPIHNSHFASNWDLAAARATKVVEMLISEAKINPQKLSAVSYGEYKPQQSNSTASGRAKNRRVDLVILSSSYTGK